MKKILITYDLRSPGQEYSSLITKIKDLGSRWHYLESTWIVKTEKTPNEILELLKPSLDSNDHIFIVDIEGKDRQGWLPKKARDWLNEN